MMLRALAESRERQARLVTDAGHELRTPLTSLRTNVELLMASMAPGAPRLPEEEMAELRADVIAQIEELSTLVGDLVDLTRDEAGGVVHEPVDMSEIIDRCLERVRRRRNDIEFDVDVTPWQVYGDPAWAVASGAQPARQRGEVEPARRAGRRAVDSDRSGARRAGRLRSRPRHSAARTPVGVRAVLPLDLRAGHAGLGLGPGDRQAGRAQTRWRASSGGHRARWTTAGHVDLRTAAWTTRFPRHGQCKLCNNRWSARTMGKRSETTAWKSGDVPNVL